MRPNPLATNKKKEQNEIQNTCKNKKHKMKTNKRDKNKQNYKDKHKTNANPLVFGMFSFIFVFYYCFFFYFWNTVNSLAPCTLGIKNVDIEQKSKKC